MVQYLKIQFDDYKGKNCKQCILHQADAENIRCTLLKDNMNCPTEGYRNDCPLININELPILDANAVRYNEVMQYNNYLYMDYTVKEYVKLFETKDKEELYQIKKDIDQKMRNIMVLSQGLLMKDEACDFILDKMNQDI